MMISTLLNVPEKRYIDADIFHGIIIVAPTNGSAAFSDAG